MSLQIRDGVAANLLAVDASLAARTSWMPTYIGSAGGRYRMSLQTNLATIISAITATGDVGQIGQFRWGSTTKTCLVDKIEIGITPVTNATAFQRITLGVRKAVLTATASGGTTTANIATVAVLTGDSGKMRASYPTTALTDFRLTDTADLTCGAGARALDVQDFLSLNTTASTVGSAPEAQKVRRSAEWTSEKTGPLVLTQDTGLSLMNRILWGAAFTATVDMAVEWRELLNAEVPTF